MNKAQLQGAVDTSWKVTAATASIFLALLTVEWLWEWPLATSIALFVAAVAGASGILGLWAQIRLILWSDDPKCPWGMWYRYEPIEAAEEPISGMRYEFSVVYAGAADSYMFQCDVAPEGAILARQYFKISGIPAIRGRPFEVFARQGRKFCVSLERMDSPLGLEVIVRARESIHILRVKPLNSWWHRMWERLKLPFTRQSEFEDDGEELGSDL